MKKKFTFISFFSGIEGFRLGLEAAGWKCVHSVEIEPFCGDVQKARYGHPPASLDINKIKAKDLPDADLWVAGWPCQGLSVAGLRKGLADDRSGLFWQFVRLLERKRPPGLLAENVPGLLTTCSCPRCGFQCKDCGAPAGAEDEACQVCGGERLGGRVLPEHRGTDLFVVLTALQRVGYGVQTRILDAQHLGVPQRRRRIFFVGHLGAPCPTEVLFEPEGGDRNPSPRGEEGKIAAGELARSLGSVGGGNDYGANKGTLVRPKRVASAVTASAGHHGHSSPRGDGTDNIVPDKAATIGTNTKPDRGQRNENAIVAATLQSVSQSHRTTDTDNLIAPTVTSRQHKGGFTDPGNDGLVTAPPPQVFEPRVARNGRGAPSSVVPPLKAQSGRTGKGDAAPCVVGPSIAAPLTAGSNPNSNAAGRRREDDQNIVATAPTLTDHKQGDGAPVVAAPRPAAAKRIAPTVTHHFERTDGETEGSRLIQQPLFIHTADANSNQNQVKTDGKTDALSKAQPGVVAFQSSGGSHDLSAGDKAPPIKVGSGLGIPSPPAIAFDPQGGGKQSNLGASEDSAGALGCTKTPAVAFNVKGMAHGGEKHAYETDKSYAVDRDGSRPSGNEAGTLVGPTPMSVRRLTPTECERLQGFPDGWTCLCNTRPDCPDRRIPPWLDPKTFKLGGCGHSICGCQCADSPRYKSLGNAVATCAVEWIGARMKVVAEARR